jgi:hypothetical protein
MFSIFSQLLKLQTESKIVSVTVKIKDVLPGTLIAAHAHDLPTPFSGHFGLAPSNGLIQPAPGSFQPHSVVKAFSRPYVIRVRLSQLRLLKLLHTITYGAASLDMEIV